MQKTRAFTAVECVIILVIVLLLGGMMFDNWHRVRVDEPAAFAAWVKQTGNPKHLTFQEWRALLHANEQETRFIIWKN